jgi:hypothetical protein
VHTETEFVQGHIACTLYDGFERRGVGMARTMPLSGSELELIAAFIHASFL